MCFKDRTSRTLTSLTQKHLLHLRLCWRTFLAKHSMLLCYSFVQCVMIRLFDDLNNDAEYRYIYPAPDVDVI